MTAKTLSETYNDVDLDHPWFHKFKLPILNSYNPSRYYFVTLAYPHNGKNDTLWNVACPEEWEAEIIASYMEYVVSIAGYREPLMREIESRPLYWDAGRNTISFVKRPNGTWAYVRMSWREKNPFPAWNAEDQYTNVLDLINHIESGYSGRISEGELYTDSWKTWREVNIANIVPR